MGGAKLSKWLLSVSIVQAAILAGCSSFQPHGAGTYSTERQPTSGTVVSNDPVEAVLLQINDVYEIAPMQQGRVGGLARVAQLKRDFVTKNPNTYLVLAGDFLSPSAIGTATVDGKELKGKQMVSTLAAAGLDLAIFGNHEFDLKKPELDERIREASGKFIWVSGNIRTPDGKPYAGLPESLIQVFRSPAGQEMRVGFLSTTTDGNKKDFIKYEDPVAYAKAEATRLRPQVDILVAITHLPLKDDMRLAAEAPEIDLIVGGHEHESMYHKRGERLIPIAKADANAKTAYVHLLKFYPKTGRVVIDSSLRQVDDTIAEHPATKAVADGWKKKAFDGFRQSGFEPERVIGTARESLDGTEAAIRNKKTNLTEIIGRSMLRDFKDGDVALFTGGGVRLDDALPVGPITEYDVIRVMPFPDTIVAYALMGRDLRHRLEYGKSKAGTGSYVQAIGAEEANGQWLVNGKPIEDGRAYKVVTNVFLGDILKKDYGADLLHKGRDSRRALIEYIQESLR